MPAATGAEDIIYFTVKRIVGGSSKRFIEKFASRDKCKGGLINQLLDCHVVYDGDPATSITLAHLPNTEVMVWADGLYLGTGTTDADGILSPLPDNESHSKIVAGLGGVIKSYTGDLTSTVTGLNSVQIAFVFGMIWGAFVAYVAVSIALRVSFRRGKQAMAGMPTRTATRQQRPPAPSGGRHG